MSSDPFRIKDNKRSKSMTAKVKEKDNCDLVVSPIKIIAKFFAPPSAVCNSWQKAKIEAFLQDLGNDSIVVDVGSSTRKLGKHVLNFDIVSNPNVDIIGDIHKMPMHDNSVDGIIVTGVIEHIENPVLAVSELHRVLKKGGVIYASIPFMQGYHPDPTDYQRYTVQGIQKLFQNFQIIEISNTRGSGSTVSWLLSEFFSIFLCFNNDKAYHVLKFTFKWLFFPLKYFDYVLKNNKFDLNITSGFTLLGRKI